MNWSFTHDGVLDSSFNYSNEYGEFSDKFTQKYAFDTISTSAWLFGVERHVCHLHKLGAGMFVNFSDI